MKLSPSAATAFRAQSATSGKSENFFMIDVYSGKIVIVNKLVVSVNM